MNILRQNTAVDVPIGPFLNLSDGYTAEDAETPAVKLSKNGQATAAKSDVTVPSALGDGYYNCELDTTDTNTVGRMTLLVPASANALPVRHEFQIVSAAVYDALYASGATGPNQLTPLDAAGVRAAVGLSAADLDTQIGAIDTVVTDPLHGNAALKTLIDAIQTDLDNGTDGLGALRALIVALPTLIEIQSAVGTELGIYDGPTKAEMDAAFAALNDLSAAQVNAEVDTALADYDAPTKTEMDAGFAGQNDLSSAQVESACNDALEALHLDHLLAVDYNPATPPGAATALLNELLESDGGVSRFTANALENAPSGGGGGGDATEAKQDTILANLATVDGLVDAIKAVTDNLPDGGALSSIAQADKLLAYVQLICRNDSAINTDRATEEAEINANEGSGGGGYNSEQHSIENTNQEMNTANAIIVGSLGSIPDLVLDEVYEGTTTMRQFLRLAAAALFGQINGAESTTVNIRDEADSKNRIQATVDANGNRTAVTLDKS